MRQHLGALAATAVLTVGLTACGGGGGGSGSPKAASKTDFCAQAAKLTSVKDGASAHTWADGLEKVGLPSDATTNERAGFKVLLADARKLPDDAKPSDLTTQTKPSAADQARLLGFLQYVQKTCPDAFNAVNPSATASPS